MRLHGVSGRILALLLPVSVALSALAVPGCEHERTREEIAAPEPGTGGGGGPEPKVHRREAPLGVFDTARGKVEVTGLRLLPRTGELVLDLRSPDLEGAGKRRVVLQGAGMSPGWKGFRASIEGGSRYRMLVAWSETEPGRARLVEETDSDRLAVEIEPEEGGDEVRETYTWNGATRSFRVKDGAQVPLSPLETDFTAFYPGTSSLESTEDGDLLVALLGDEEFQGWVLGEVAGAAGYSTGEISRMPRELNRFCNWISGCVLLKCSFLGIYNPICHACFGSAIACFVAFMVCEVIGQTC
jgi:hypothetical protein